MPEIIQLHAQEIIHNLKMTKKNFHVGYHLYPLNLWTVFYSCTLFNADYYRDFAVETGYGLDSKLIVKFEDESSTNINLCFILRHHF